MPLRANVAKSGLLALTTASLDCHTSAMNRNRGTLSKSCGVGFALAASVVLAGCGGGAGSSPGAGGGSGGGSGSTPNSAAPASLPAACDLLTKPVVKSIIGAGAKRTIKAQPNPKETHCHFLGKTTSIDLIVGPWSYINTPNPTEKKVSGIGDSATVSSIGMNVQKGDNGLEMQVSITGSFSGGAANQVLAKQEKLEKKLAKELLPKI
jgi:hypothetical protein